MAGDKGPEEGTRVAVAQKAHQDQQKASWMVNFQLLAVNDSVLLFGFNVMDLVAQHSF